MRQDVPQRLVRQSEQHRVLAPHLPLQEEPDVGQGFARNRQDLRVADVHQVDAHGDGAIGIATDT